jgi:hypothetical protein
MSARFLRSCDEVSANAETNYFGLLSQAALIGNAVLRMPCPNGFQIFFEGRRFFFFLESKVGDEFPRNKFGSMRGIAAVMAEKSLFEIARRPYVIFAWMGFGSEEIDVMHVIWLACQR